MTNEEKAKEIAKQNAREYLPQNPGFSIDECEKSALEIAQWKDQQFNTKIALFFHLVQDGISFERAYKQVTGKDWQSETPEAPEKEAAKPAWVKFIEKFEEGSDEWRVTCKLLQKYDQKGYDIHRNIPGELLEELKNVYNIQV